MKANKYLLLLLAFLPLLFFRDFTPDNELKYLSIADEAIRYGNFFTFTNHGIAYADKPPLYLWIVILGKLLFGTHSMLFLGLFSIIPALVVLYVMDKWIATEADQNSRLSAQLMLITSGYFIGAGIVLRMDMLMCMFIVLALYTFYQMYTGKDTKWSSYLFPFYTFMALFTKGPFGLLIPILSVIAFLTVKGELKTFGRYWGVKAWCILLAGSAIWFTGVFMEGGYTYLHNLLFNQTVNRAVDSFHHKKPFYFYFEAIWYSLAPWSLLYIGVLFAGIKARLIKTDLEKFFLTIITLTFVGLSLVSSKVEVYMLPAFPFFAYLAVLLLKKVNQSKFVSALIAIPLVIIGAAFPAIIILSRIKPIALLNTPLIYVLTAFLLVIAVLALYYLYKQRNLNKSIYTLAAGLLITIFAGSFFIPSYNEYIGYGEMCKTGEEIARQKGIDSFYFYNSGRMENIDAYLKRDLKELKETDLNKKQCGKAILFVRIKDVNRTPSLKKMVKGKQKIVKGDCFIIIL